MKKYLVNYEDANYEGNTKEFETYKEAETFAQYIRENDIDKWADIEEFEIPEIRIDNWFMQDGKTNDIVPFTNNEKQYESYAYCYTPESLKDYNLLNEENKNLIGKKAHDLPFKIGENYFHNIITLNKQEVYLTASCDADV